MPVLIGLGILVGGVAALFGYFAICALIGSSFEAVVALFVLWILSVADLMGNGIVHDNHIPLWGWLPAVITTFFLVGTVAMAEGQW